MDKLMLINEPDWQGRCPFCTGKVAFVLGPSYGALHSRPTCPKFDELNPLEFVTAVRKALEPNAS